jgi:hypothetical protein
MNSFLDADEPMRIAREDSTTMGKMNMTIRVSAGAWRAAPNELMKIFLNREAMWRLCQHKKEKKWSVKAYVNLAGANQDCSISGTIPLNKIATKTLP